MKIAILEILYTRLLSSMVAESAVKLFLKLQLLQSRDRLVKYESNDFVENT